MAGPEQVSWRVERAEQDITAIWDTTLDIKETVDGHTETLAEHGRTLADHGRKLDDITGRFDTLETRINQGSAEILRRLGKRSSLRLIPLSGDRGTSDRLDRQGCPRRDGCLASVFA